MFYLIDKEKGISSFKAIKKFAKENNIKKIGHTGTLDPLATGLLLLASEDDTKLIEYIDKGPKTYVVQFKLGFVSDTFDIEGQVSQTNIEPKGNVEEVIKSFQKTYMQTPPNFSAKKVNGKRAYQLARSGIEVKIKSSKVTISEIDKIKKISEDVYEFELTVSRGTYIRSIINEIGQMLESGAIMTELRRIMVADLKERDLGIIEPKKIIRLPSISNINLKDLFNGKKIQYDALEGKYIVEFHEEIIGLIDIKDNLVIKRKLFGKKYERLLNESC